MGTAVQGSQTTVPPPQRSEMGSNRRPSFLPTQAAMCWKEGPRAMSGEARQQMDKDSTCPADRKQP